MKYEFPSKPQPVVKAGEFIFAAAHLDHSHIQGQCDGLIAAGGELRYVYDTDPARRDAFCQRYPQVRAVDTFEQILDDPEVALVTTAAIPNERGPIGCRVMEAGKDYFSDKAPFTSLEQLDAARKIAADTGRKYMVYYGERLNTECSVFAEHLIANGAIGRVVQVSGFGPHRLNAKNRPAWFFEKAKYGGILCDIGSHMLDQILFFTGSSGGSINYASVANYHSKKYPELEDFGEASVRLDNNTSGYFRVDWLTPDGLSTWGDGRTIILGTKGYIEMRKYVDVAREKTGDHLFLVDQEGEYEFSLSGKIGFPFFGQLILDCLHRTETAMTQAHAFKAAELCLQCQAAAVRLE